MNPPSLPVVPQHQAENWPQRVNLPCPAQSRVCPLFCISAAPTWSQPNRLLRGPSGLYHFHSCPRRPCSPRQPQGLLKIINHNIPLPSSHTIHSSPLFCSPLLRHSPCLQKPPPSSSSALPLAYSVPATPVSSLFLEHARLVSASGPLHMLFPLPGMLLSWLLPDWLHLLPCVSAQGQLPGEAQLRKLLQPLSHSLTHLCVLFSSLCSQCPALGLAYHNCLVFAD